MSQILSNLLALFFRHVYSEEEYVEIIKKIGDVLETCFHFFDLLLRSYEKYSEDILCNIDGQKRNSDAVYNFFFQPEH